MLQSSEGTPCPEPSPPEICGSANGKSRDIGAGMTLSTGMVNHRHRFHVVGICSSAAVSSRIFGRWSRALVAELCAELRQKSITLGFARVRNPVREQMHRAGLEAAIGEDRFYETITDGVNPFLARQDR